MVTLTEFDLDALHDGGPPLEEWYLTYAPSLFGYAARRLGRAHAEDLTAQVVVEAQRTEFAAKVGLLSALTIVCAARPLLILLREAMARRSTGPAVTFGR